MKFIKNKKMISSMVMLVGATLIVLCVLVRSYMEADFTPAPSQNVPSSFSVNGQIFLSDTKEPAADASISFYSDYRSSITVQTDANGKYSIASLDNTYDSLSIYKDSYQALGGNFTHTSAANVALNLALNPGSGSQYAQFISIGSSSPAKFALSVIPQQSQLSQLKKIVPVGNSYAEQDINQGGPNLQQGIVYTFKPDQDYTLIVGGSKPDKDFKYFSISQNSIFNLANPLAEKIRLRNISVGYSGQNYSMGEALSQHLISNPAIKRLSDQNPSAINLSNQDTVICPGEFITFNLLATLSFTITKPTTDDVPRNITHLNASQTVKIPESQRNFETPPTIDKTYLDRIFSAQSYLSPIDQSIKNQIIVAAQNQAKAQTAAGLNVVIVTDGSGQTIQKAPVMIWLTGLSQPVDPNSIVVHAAKTNYSLSQAANLSIVNHVTLTTNGQAMNYNPADPNQANIALQNNTLMQMEVDPENDPNIDNGSSDPGESTGGVSSGDDDSITATPLYGYDVQYNMPTCESKRVVIRFKTNTGAKAYLGEGDVVTADESDYGDMKTEHEISFIPQDGPRQFVIWIENEDNQHVLVWQFSLSLFCNPKIVRENVQIYRTASSSVHAGFNIGENGDIKNPTNADVELTISTSSENLISKDYYNTTVVDAELDELSAKPTDTIAVSVKIYNPGYIGDLNHLTDSYDATLAPSCPRLDYTAEIHGALVIIHQSPTQNGVTYPPAVAQYKLKSQTDWITLGNATFPSPGESQSYNLENLDKQQDYDFRVITKDCEIGSVSFTTNAFVADVFATQVSDDTIQFEVKANATIGLTELHIYDETNDNIANILNSPSPTQDQFITWQSQGGFCKYFKPDEKKHTFYVDYVVHSTGSIPESATGTKTFEVTASCNKITDIEASCDSNNTAIFSWVTATPSQGYVEYGKTSQYGSNTATTPTGITHYSYIKNLDYYLIHYRIVSFTEGNPSDKIYSKDDVVVCGPPSAPTQNSQPAQSNSSQPASVDYSPYVAQTINQNTTTSTITYSTKIAATTMIEYGTQPNNYPNKIYVDKIDSTQHEISIPNLKSRTYYYRIVARDTDGNEHYSQEMELKHGNAFLRFFGDLSERILSLFK